MDKIWAESCKVCNFILFGLWRVNRAVTFKQAPKSLKMVTAVMKLKDACSLEEKL